MGWLFALIFGGLAAVLALFLFLHWEERRRAAMPKPRKGRNRAWVGTTPLREVFLKMGGL